MSNLNQLMKLINNQRIINQSLFSILLVDEVICDFIHDCDD